MAATDFGFGAHGQGESVPIIPRGADRRVAPRRAEEVTLHYARENLIAAVLADWDTLDEDDIVDPVIGLSIAAYLDAERAAQAVAS